MSFGLFSFAKLPRSRTWFFSKMEAHSFSAFKLCTLCGMVNDSKSRLCINDHYSPCSCFPPISLGVDFALKFGWIFEEKNSKRPFGGLCSVWWSSDPVLCLHLRGDYVCDIDSLPLCYLILLCTLKKRNNWLSLLLSPIDWAKKCVNCDEICLQ